MEKNEAQSPPLILLVEDDVDLRGLIKEVLEGEGFDVIVAEDGQKALDLLHIIETFPVVILVDYKMPLLNGLEFREQQLKFPRLAHIPVVIMSADNQIENEVRKSRLQIPFLKKPFNIETVLNAIQMRIGKKPLMKQP